MPRLRLGSSIWLDPDRPQIDLEAPRLDTTLTTDVAIVGGGLTGAVVAQACIARGLSVAVLESQRCRRRQHRGQHRAARLRARRAADDAGRPLRPRGGAAHLAPVARRHRRAHRHAARAGACRAISPRDRRSTSPRRERAAARLRHEYELRRAHGLRGRWLEGAGAARARGGPRHGGDRNLGHAQLDPYRACRGLLAAAARRGARVFERTRVTRIDTTPRGVRVHTRGGSVRARSRDRRHRLRHARVPPARRLVLAVAHLRDDHGADGAGRSRTGRHSRRAAVEHGAAVPLRAMGTGGTSHRRRRRSSTGARNHERAAAFARGRRRLARELRTLCPALRGVPFERAWEGLFAVTPGRACPTWARTRATRAISSRSATAATGWRSRASPHACWCARSRGGPIRI